MKKSLFLAALPALLLSACATVETSVDGAQAQAPAGDTMYCWKERLNDTGKEYTCNWAATTKEACHGTSHSAIAKSAVVQEPVNAKRCDNGQWLVQVSRR